MKLKNIRIQNYRSIKDITFDIKKLDDDSYTYGLIGVNEAGKSSFLKAIALKDKHFSVSKKDFKNPSEDIRITYLYELSDSDRDLLEQLGQVAFDNEQEKLNFWPHLTYSLNYSYSDPQKHSVEVEMVSVDDSKLPLTIPSIQSLGLHDTVFWTAEEKYLMSKPIALSTFANNQEVSIPLKNCFILAGYKDIPEAVNRIVGDSTEKSLLQDTLSEATTSHIKSVWPDHPININFDIDNGVINFHVKDDDVKKAKTADQRSDGFKQFISFLLTISAEDKKGILENKILLLDEPETHLHPQAQIYLLEELKKITKNDRNNLVLFATHSNFMIDKSDLSRNFKVEKKKDDTEITRFEKHSSSYASITCDVFNIYTTDYHNELYSKLHDNFLSSLDGENPNGSLKYFDEQFFVQLKKLKKDYPLLDKAKAATLPTYIRNCIHHAENGNPYKYEDLVESTDMLKKFLI